ncbi:hypothetical protein A3Q56_03651 [Intoshia linei]|uniref:hydroxyacylglutathione hydrolase n=1 Tax=Intoshia linei TaxID=1819745 RepID=A0A177B589_9BILA|nr:hypothetical protein A3Q56_03651 [Intoshia linei]
MKMFNIKILKAFEDNYMYVVYDSIKKLAIAVDPADSNIMSSFINENKLNLKAILTTHHHSDHAGGNEQMNLKYPEAKIYGGDTRIPKMTDIIGKHCQEIECIGLKFICLKTPCHTKGHICYYTDNLPTPIVFTGDTLFSMGCGRFFEGDAEQMETSLNKIIAKLDPKTKVYFGHEYTAKNLNFVCSIEQNNGELKKYKEIVDNTLSKGEYSSPSNLKDELSYNPFMRTSESNLQNILRTDNPISTMKVLRKMKNEF